MAQTNLVRVQEKGQVTVPASIRRKLGIDKGSLVAVTKTAGGALITPQEVIAMNALDKIGKALRDQGISLDELIESERDEWDDLLREHYGIEPDGSS
jgi:AbrB family looped-hinge helix DNA binding protein